MLAAGDFHHEVALVWVQILNSGRNRGIKLVANAQLSVVVQAPSKNLVFIVDIETMLVTAENINGLLGANFLDL